METVRDRHISMDFDDMFEVINYVMPQYHVNYRHYKELINRSNHNINAGPTIHKFDDAINYALIGDEFLYNYYVKGMVEQLNNALGIYTNDYIQQVPVIKRRKVNKSFGDELNIHAVNQGHLDTAWRTTERIEFNQEKHLITILIDIGGNWNIKPLDTLWVAAMCVKFVNDLEIAGKSVQIIVGGAASYCSESGERLTISATVKRYNQSFSLERLAAMAHIGFYRTFGFAGKLMSSFKLTESLGYSESFGSNGYMPLPIQDEIELGHTKVIVVDKALSLEQAVRSLNRAYIQLKEAAGGPKG